MNRMPRNYLIYALLCCVMGLNCLCSKKGGSNNDPDPPDPPGGPAGPDAEFWMTTGSGSALLAKQSTLSFGTIPSSSLNLDIDTTTSMQTVDGFGYTLTGGSAYLINSMSGSEKKCLAE
ncbi:MAG: hypothetical protein WDO16_00895 [Bacteroidota bacterium]